MSVLRRRGCTETQKKRPCEDGDRLERCSHKPRDAKDRLEPPEPKREAWSRFSLKASRRNQPCWLDFGQGASQPVIECISIVSSYPVCGNLLQQPQETMTRASVVLGALLTARVYLSKIKSNKSFMPWGVDIRKGSGFRQKSGDLIMAISWPSHSTSWKSFSLPMM